METHDKIDKLEMLKIISLLITLLLLTSVVIYLAKNYDNFSKNPIDKFLEDKGYSYLNCYSNNGENIVFLKEGEEMGVLGSGATGDIVSIKQ